MNELPFINDVNVFRKEIKDLISKREENKSKMPRQYSLSKMDRKDIWNKTDGKCHICGREVEEQNYEADHVKNYTGGGSNLVENFLASCRTCNNYRWHYSPEEIQWILKLGVWAKTQIDRNTNVGNAIAKSFIKSEIAREKRRKYPREPKS